MAGLRQTKKEKILVFGGSGQIGSRFIEMFSDEFKIIAPTHSQVDVTKKESVQKSIEQINPNQILYAAGFTNFDKAPEMAKECFLLNSGSLIYISYIAKKKKIPVHYLSTEVVFNGYQSQRPYKETDQPDPLSVIAASKRLGETAVLSESPINTVLRLIICYSANFSKKLDLARLILSKLEKGETFTSTSDQEINPIFVDHLVSAISKIIQNHAAGIYHLGATDYTIPYEFSRKIAKSFNLNLSLLKPTSFKQFSKTRPEPRPQHEWLDVKKFVRDFGKGILKTVDEGIEEFIFQHKQSLKSSLRSDYKNIF